MMIFPFAASCFPEVAVVENVLLYASEHLYETIAVWKCHSELK